MVLPLENAGLHTIKAKPTPLVLVNMMETGSLVVYRRMESEGSQYLTDPYYVPGARYLIVTSFKHQNIMNLTLDSIKKKSKAKGNEPRKCQDFKKTNLY